MPSVEIKFTVGVAVLYHLACQASTGVLRCAPLHLGQSYVALDKTPQWSSVAVFLGMNFISVCPLARYPGESVVDWALVLSLHLNESQGVCTSV